MVSEHITNIPCDKHSGKRAHTQMLIVHSIESPLANGYAVSMANNWLGKWYQANGALIEASSNVIVSPDTLVRSVHTDYAAWHASWANSLSVGYEQAGYAAYTREQWLTPAGRDQIDRLAREMALDAAQYGIPLVWLTQAQVNAIAAGNRTIKGLVTHSVIDPVNRTDPGTQYPYDVLLASIKAYSGDTTPQSSNTEPIQEDDVITPEDRLAIARTVLDFQLNQVGGGKITLANMLSEYRPHVSTTHDKLTKLPNAVVNAEFSRVNTQGKVDGAATLSSVLGVHDANVVLTRGVITGAAEAVAKTVAAIQTDSGISPEEQGKRAAAAFLAEVEGLSLSITGGDK